VAAIERAIEQTNRRRRAVRVAAAAVVLLGLGAGALATRHGSIPTAMIQKPEPAAAQPERAAPEPSNSVALVAHPVAGGATLLNAGSTAASVPLTDGISLEAGSRILARPDGHVRLALSTGTQLVVEEGGDVTVVDRGPNQVFSIRRGSLRALVAKLDVGQRFMIRTPDSEVEVRGTSFRVAIAEPDSSSCRPTMTRVNVFEGVVSVRQGSIEARVAAGQEWPPPCPTPPKARTVARVSRRAVAGSPPPDDPDVAPSREETPPEKIEAASDLRDQNDVYARALAAKRAGRIREAADGFEAFVARYPSSHLVESAMVERMQALGKIDRGRAALAAKQYLARYPTGFARGEAEAIQKAAP
jgi:hypothetical protein